MTTRLFLTKQFSLAPKPLIQYTLFAVLFSIGCGDNTAERPPEPPPDTGERHTTPDDSGPLTTESIDCSVPPQGPFTIEEVPGAKGYHGLVFTQEGQIIGADGELSASLISANSAGDWQVFSPNIGTSNQVDQLEDGTIVMVVNNEIVAYDLNGVPEVIAAPPGLTYGLRVGPDNQIYLQNKAFITRVDPVTHNQETWVNPEFHPKVMDFSPDGTVAYIGTVRGDGEIWAYNLDDQYNPVGPPYLYSSTPGTYHDGLTVDVCGNLYVAEFFSNGMYRIAPNGELTTLYSWSKEEREKYGHGAVFSGGVGGFSDHHLFIPQPFNSSTVISIDVGFPHRSYQGAVVNIP